MPSCDSALNSISMVLGSSSAGRLAAASGNSSSFVRTVVVTTTLSTSYVFWTNFSKATRTPPVTVKS